MVDLDTPAVASPARGAVAGLVGGLAFGGAMIDLGLLESIALLVRSDSSPIGFAVHLVVAVVLGVGFGALVSHHRPEPGETIIWGLTYGAVWWFLGAMTLLPVLSGEPVAWEVAAARSLVPALIGHLLYGVVAGLVLAFGGLVGPGAGGRVAAVAPAYVPVGRPSTGSLVRGGLAGLVGAGLLGTALEVGGDGPAPSAAMGDAGALTGWLVTSAVGIGAGLVFATLFPGTVRGGGPTLVRGAAFGVVWWLVIALTLLPLLRGRGLLWTAGDVREGFGTLPGYVLLLGAVPAYLSHLLAKLSHALLSDDLSDRPDEGLGAQSLRVVARGAVAGSIGGLIFTVVMLRIGFLSTVAELVGLGSSLVGLLVHLVIAIAIGVGYGVLFVRRSNDAGSALGWGVAYGATWWLAGPLTLLPILLGDGPTWTIDAAREAYPALVGHLAYGAFLGLAFHRLEVRHNPWWLPRNQAEAERAARATFQLTSSAPALWLLMVLLTVSIPVLVG